MACSSRYIITENIERFETLLRAGRLDSRQTTTVEFLLAQARNELAMLDSAAVAVNQVLCAVVAMGGLVSILM
jgi:hypothetical protein